MTDKHLLNESSRVFKDLWWQWVWCAKSIWRSSCNYFFALHFACCVFFSACLGLQCWRHVFSPQYSLHIWVICWCVVFIDLAFSGYLLECAHSIIVKIFLLIYNAPQSISISTNRFNFNENMLFSTSVTRLSSLK